MEDERKSNSTKFFFSFLLFSFFSPPLPLPPPPLFPRKVYHFVKTSYLVCTTDVSIFIIINGKNDVTEQLVRVTKQKSLFRHYYHDSSEIIATDNH